MNTLLYVEDNFSNLRLVERVVDRRPGIKLLTATRGKLGLELAREHRPALVLLDRQRPDISGDEVLTQLRADPRTARTPVFMVSADVTRAAMDRLPALGACGYVTKPFVVSRLLALLDEHLPGRAEPGVRASPSHQPHSDPRQLR